MIFFLNVKVIKFASGVSRIFKVKLAGLCFCCCCGVPQMRTLGVTQCIQMDSDKVSKLKNIYS